MASNEGCLYKGDVVVKAAKKAKLDCGMRPFSAQLASSKISAKRESYRVINCRPIKNQLLYCCLNASLCYYILASKALYAHVPRCIAGMREHM